jgi:Holliday junction DNA helicase RuvA
MIGWLRGRLVGGPSGGEVLVDVGGVGYRVTVPPALAAAVGGDGDAVELHVHTHVREDALVLYGFARLADRRMFEVLLGAHGVGPSLALAILGTLGADGLVRAVVDEDVDALCTVPGVGRKTAARLVIDLASKLDGALTAPSTGAGGGPTAALRSARADVRDALVELGYGTDEIKRAVGALGDEDAPVEDLLRRALRVLAGSR